MKKVFFFLFLAMAMTISCSKKSERNEDYLYSKMIEYSNHFSNLTELNSTATRSANKVIDSGYLSFVDTSVVDAKFKDMINLYCQPENFLLWDERGVISLIATEERFTNQEIDLFVKCISGVYSMKGKYALVQTRSMSNVECYQQLVKEQKRASRTFLIALAAAAILEPEGPIGEYLAYLYYAAAMNDAQEDYEECISKCK